MIDRLFVLVPLMIVASHLTYGNCATVLHGWLHYAENEDKRPHWMEILWRAHTRRHFYKTAMPKAIWRWSMRWQLALTPLAAWGIMAPVAILIHGGTWSLSERWLFWGIDGAAAMVGIWSYILLYRTTVRRSAGYHSERSMPRANPLVSRRYHRHMHETPWKEWLGIRWWYELLWRTIDHRVGRRALRRAVHLCGVVCLRLAGRDHWPYWDSGSRR